MTAIQRLLTEHIGIWTAAEAEKKSGRGRRAGNATTVYGVKKLRELILELALRGKLVPQDASNEPASELLKRIQIEKNKLIAAGVIKKSADSPSIAENERPFPPPPGWTWARMSSCSKQITDGEHLTPERTADISQIALVTAKNVRDGSMDYTSTDFVSFDVAKKCWGRCKPEINDILIVSVGATIGRLTIIDDYRDMVIVRSVTLVKPLLINVQYLALALRSPLLQRTIWAGVKQNAQPCLYLSVSNNMPIPIPPLAEQRRIVAKVEELMALCDQLEDQHSDAADAHELIVSHMLGTFTQSQSATSFNINWQRIAAHFDTMFTTEASIDALKQTLLQLAVMGKLVPQDQDDEPASELLNRIQAEKEGLVAAGKIKKGKAPKKIGENEKSFSVPKKWKWVRLIDLLSKIGSGSTPLGGKNVYVDSGVPFLRSQNVWDDGLRLDDVVFIENRTHTKMSGTHVFAGDLLFNITGASIGRCAIVPEFFETGNVSQHVTIIRPASSEILKFLHLILTSKHVQQTVMDVQVGVSREGLSIGKLGQFVIPIPPLQEQQRIIAKVDLLMALCDQLKSRVVQANRQQKRLADVVMEQASIG